MATLVTRSYDTESGMVGISVPFGAGNLLADYARIRDKMTKRR